MRAFDDSHFDASDPVGRYWLTNGAGFTVVARDGRTLGVVEHVVLDRRRESATRLIVRRRGLVRRPRYVALEPREIESVSPDAKLFLVPWAGKTAISRSTTAATRARGVAASAGAAGRAFARASRPVASELDRRLARGAEAALRLSRRGAVRARREAPKLDAWLAAQAHEIGRATTALLRTLGVAALTIVRVLGELVVLAAVGVVALWRRTTEALAPEARTTPEVPKPEPPEWRRDADAPLARERTEARARARARTPRRSRR